MKEIGVIDLYGKVYVSVDNLVQFCREQEKKSHFATIACQVLLSGLIQILIKSKTEIAPNMRVRGSNRK
jgi:hypothetical protein